MRRTRVGNVHYRLVLRLTLVMGGHKASDKLAKLRKSLSPEELEKVLEDPSLKGTRFFKRLVEEKRRMGTELRRSPAGARQIAQAKALYDDLVSDGYLKLDFGLFSRSSLREAYQIDHSHEGVGEHFGKVESKNFHESVLAMAQIYRVNFENIFKEFLRPMAELIENRSIKSNGDALATLTGYRQGKFKDLFRILIPQIRNSVDHSDFLIDDKKREVVFRDRKKPPLVLGEDVFRGIFMESFMLKLSISTAAFELEGPLLDDVIQQLERVGTFVEKNKLRLVPKEGGPSIYEIGKELEKLGWTKTKSLEPN